MKIGDLNNERLAELRKLHRLTTPGPWRAEQAHDLWSEIRRGWGASNQLVADCLSDSDARFVAAAHDAMPDLLRAAEIVAAMPQHRDHDESPWPDYPELVAMFVELTTERDRLLARLSEVHP